MCHLSFKISKFVIEFENTAQWIQCGIILPITGISEYLKEFYDPNSGHF